MLKIVSKWIVKSLMKMFPSIPDENDLAIWEIFNHEQYTKASSKRQDEIKLNSARYRYQHEREYCFFEVSECVKQNETLQTRIYCSTDSLTL